MIPHYNYYPPAGAVVDASDGRARWSGRAWTLNGKPYNVPSSHRLIGAPQGPLNGWVYDWKLKAWMEPSAPTAPKPTPTAPSRPGARPSSFAGPRPAPLAPQPQAPAQTQQPTTTTPKEDTSMEKKGPHTVLEDLMKHPIAPVAGALLFLAAYVTDEPTPPVIPDGLPEPVAKQWQMIFAQNQQRYGRRMDLYRDLGMVLLGYSGSRSVVDVLAPRLAAMKDGRALAA